MPRCLTLDYILNHEEYDGFPKCYFNVLESILYCEHLYFVVTSADFVTSDVIFKSIVR